MIAGKCAVVAGVLSACVASPALAGYYYGAIDFGLTRASDVCSTSLPVTGCKDTAFMSRLTLGSQFTPELGAEISYGSYGKGDMGTLGPISADWELNGFQISGTGSFSISDDVALVGKIGIVRADLKVSGAGGAASYTDKVSGLTFGMGARYIYSDRIALRAQYEDLGSNISLISAGVMFRF